jgi:hypothetical protein
MSKELTKILAGVGAAFALAIGGTCALVWGIQTEKDRNAYITDMFSHEGIDISDHSVMGAVGNATATYNLQDDVILSSAPAKFLSTKWAENAVATACAHPGASKIDNDPRSVEYPEIAEQAKQIVATFKQTYC